ncbi:UvrD-helicase domain-containing protein [Lyngbya confervoides]|uniref:DNA 3'-5' helicase n=1 Tax=Lyngbya confervoides BDU141951 TaxID=1574623 RepID=A0ABD4T699_9CYAN|nr:UvrD-helicase domain-containing protein [Lyngbya confervoides]MCM1983974.1 AAA family ATPase [Lyngbya confervoides BDU141951]
MKIAVSQTFLQSIVNTPKNVLLSLNQFIRNVEADSQYLRKAEKVEGGKCFKLKISNSYRLFYIHKSDFMILLDIRKRNGKTYKNLEPIKDAQRIYSESDNFHEIEIAELIVDEPQSEETIIKIADLIKSRIPKKYWDKLLRITDEDEILNLDLPIEYIDYIIENFTLNSSTSIEEVENDTFYNLSSESDFNKYINNDISRSEYIIRNLYLTDEQKAILENSEPGPVLVKGGPGTGKSILALYKVKRLLESGENKILFTTHNEALAEQSKDYLETLIGSELEKFSVEVKTVTEVAEEIFFANNSTHKICDQKQANLILDSSIELMHGVQGISQFFQDITSSYILEEFQLVIDGRGIKSEQDYIDNPRFGRDKQLNKSQRKIIWKIYLKWTDLLDKSGLLTIEKLKCKVLSQVETNKTYFYNHIIVDEAQDLSPIALKLLFNLAPKEGFYLTADTDQSLYQRSFGWDHIQHYIGYQGETKELKKGFRSVYEVWRAYNNIVPGFRSARSERQSGSKPELLFTDDPITQVEYIKDFLDRSVRENPKHPRFAAVILVPNADYGNLLSSQLTHHKLPAEYVDSRENYGLSDRWIKVMSVQDSKGLEFPFVVVAGLKEGIFPQNITSKNTHEAIQIKKQYQQLFYVACSRAKYRLLVCASTIRPSSLLKGINESYWNCVRK